MVRTLVLKLRNESNKVNNNHDDIMIIIIIIIAHMDSGSKNSLPSVTG